MNFDDIELRLRYPHIFREQEYTSHSLLEKAASLPNNPKRKTPGLNWLNTVFQQLRQIAG